MRENDGGGGEEGGGGFDEIGTGTGAGAGAGMSSPGFWQGEASWSNGDDRQQPLFA